MKHLILSASLVALVCGIGALSTRAGGDAYHQPKIQIVDPAAPELLHKSGQSHSHGHGMGAAHAHGGHGHSQHHHYPHHEHVASPNTILNESTTTVDSTASAAEEASRSALGFVALPESDFPPSWYALGPVEAVAWAAIGGAAAVIALSFVGAWSHGWHKHSSTEQVRAMLEQSIAKAEASVKDFADSSGYRLPHIAFKAAASKLQGAMDSRLPKAAAGGAAKEQPVTEGGGGVLAASAAAGAQPCTVKRMRARSIASAGQAASTSSTAAAAAAAPPPTTTTTQATIRLSAAPAQKAGAPSSSSSSAGGARTYAPVIEITFPLRPVSTATEEGARTAEGGPLMSPHSELNAALQEVRRQLMAMELAASSSSDASTGKGKQAGKVPKGGRARSGATAAAAVAPAAKPPPLVMSISASYTTTDKDGRSVTVPAPLGDLLASQQQQQQQQQTVPSSPSAAAAAGPSVLAGGSTSTAEPSEEEVDSRVMAAYREALQARAAQLAAMQQQQQQSQATAGGAKASRVR